MEPALALTFDKIQGETLLKIILQLEQRAFLPKIDLCRLNVGISRTREVNGFRILPARSLSYLKDLKCDKYLRVWMQWELENNFDCSAVGRKVGFIVIFFLFSIPASMNLFSV